MRFIGGGVLTVDIVQLCDRHFAPEDSDVFYAAGGTIANVLAYLSALDKSSHCVAVGAIGDDELGEAALLDLASFGVRCGLVERQRGPSRRVMHLISREYGHRFSTTCTACQRVFPRFHRQVSPQALDAQNSSTTPAIVFVDRTTEFALQLARQVAFGGAVVFEPTRVGDDDDALQQLIRLARVVKVSVEIPDRMRIVRAFEHEANGAWKLLVETRGADGISIRSNDGQVSVSIPEVPSVRVKDAGGAGDACTAGFLSGLGRLILAEELPSLSAIHAAARRGQALGAIACAFLGARGPLYALTAQELHDAVEETLNTDRVGEFRPAAPPNMTVRSSHPSVCRICRLPSI